MPILPSPSILKSMRTTPLPLQRLPTSYVTCNAQSLLDGELLQTTLLHIAASQEKLMCTKLYLV